MLFNKHFILIALGLFVCDVQSAPFDKESAWDKTNIKYNTAKPAKKTTVSLKQYNVLSEKNNLDLASIYTRFEKIRGVELIRTRGAKEAKLFKKVAKSTVLVITEDAIGSGSVISNDGKVITNWHVVGDHEVVGVAFMPKQQGEELSKKDFYRANVARYDQVTDLALLVLEDKPRDMKIMELSDLKNLEIGNDVHAIGHPTGETWTYTKGFVSQIRNNYEWITEEGIKHHANVIQNQTPINPGNSGGPLFDDEGKLLGVNSFKGSGEALNFAVSADEVRKFLVREGNRKAERIEESAKACDEPVHLGEYRNEEGDSDVIVIDADCDGAGDLLFTIPDDEASPWYMAFDSTGDNKTDTIILDKERDGKWDYSLYDVNGDGEPDLIGYHPDGDIEPSRIEEYS